MQRDRRSRSQLRGLQKDILDLVMEAQDRGWRVEVRRHVHLYSPKGRHLITISKSPSDHRTLRNLRAQIRRASWPEDTAG